MDLIQAATQSGEALSIILISLALIVFGVAYAKSRSTKSLQFQMLLFVLVLFAAEIPRILGTLEIVDVSSYEDLGLEIHSVSMVVLVAFMAYRVYGFMKEG